MFVSLRSRISWPWVASVPKLTWLQPIPLPAGGVCFERMVVDPRKVPRRLQKLRRKVFPAEFTAGTPNMARHGSWVVQAVRAGKGVGYVWATPAVSEDKVCLIAEVGVLPDHQRVGIGSQLVQESARWMLELGFETAWIGTFPNRPPWFMGLGFEADTYGLYSAPISLLL